MASISVNFHLNNDEVRVKVCKIDSTTFLQLSTEQSYITLFLTFKQMEQIAMDIWLGLHPDPARD